MIQWLKELFAKSKRYETEEVREIQQRLADLGVYKGDVDGEFGEKTSDAVVEFKESRGLKPRDYVGPVTHSVLFDTNRDHYTSGFVVRVQNELAVRGFYFGRIDGDFGPETSAAVIAFKKSRGLAARDYIGPITKAVLFDRRTPQEEKEGEPVWLRRARMEIGVREYKGQKHNKKILGYWKSAFLAFKDDETPWCAGFVCAMLEEVGVKSTRSGMARSFTRWGKKLDKPIPGAIVVFWRGSRQGTSGHVGFVTGEDQEGRILCLGGNQSDAVNIKPFSKDRVLGYYWPDAVPVLNATIEIVSNNLPDSENEA